MKNFLSKIKSHLPSKRRIIQLYAALLFNANIKGFITGQIYQGNLKGVCTPGLNCYSCPGASGACPLGSLQNALYESGKRTPYYILGIILLYSILFGRFICGFLCPFGLIQDLLHKIKTPKLKKNRVTKALSYLKYVILVFFVFIVPLLYAFRNYPLPGFCKYICPAGTLEGAIGLLSNSANESSLGMLGPLFTWKFLLLVSFIVGAIFIYRMFCRFFCPLGALYGLFNRIAILGIKLEKPKCTHCGRCITKCKMDISSAGDHECINCGECIDVCPTKAITWRGSKIFLAPNEIDEREKKGADLTEMEILSIQEKQKKVKKRNFIIKITAAILMASLLTSALVYYNFIDEPPTVNYEGNDDLERGGAVGNLCYDYPVQLVDKTGILNGKTLDPSSTGRITVINFWGVWCTGCLKELPYFDRIATEYKDSVSVLAIHSDLLSDMEAEYITKNYPSSEMIFGKDDQAEGANADTFYTMLGGSGFYPITVVLDERGVIIEKFMRELTYEELKAVIDSNLN